MPDPCELLPWDSEFFGFPVARAAGASLTPESVREIDCWCGARGVRCLYFLASPDDADTTLLAERNGYRLVDVRITLRRPGSTVAGAAVRPVRRQEIPALEAISRECYRDTRFYYDKEFPRHLAVALYETWVRRSCEGYADAVLVADSGDGVAGYITCHLEGARIGLAGVASRARGSGVGRTLVEGALDWFARRGVFEVFVVTQGRNVAAQRLYQRCGFLTHAVGLWYHKWYPRP